MLWVASSGAWGAIGAATEVDFDDVFLRQPNGASIDPKRFSKGNVVLPGDYRADLYANSILLGRAQITLRQVSANAGDVQACFDPNLLERVGVDLTKLTPDASASLATHDDTCLTLPSLVSDATATFDSSEQRLDVSVPQIALVRSARGYVEPRYWDDGVTAATLQYNANVYHSKAQGVSSTSEYLGLNAGFNAGPWRLRHQGNLNHDNQYGTTYQSMQTNLQRSIAPFKAQLTLGEAYTSGSLFDSVGFRGVQLASDDRMYPESQRGYAPTVRGIARTNARVQVRQNGNIIYETTVAPGAFEINDLYATGYGGNLNVVVTEADGSVHTSSVPYAAAVNALRTGVTRFSVTAGEYRNSTLLSEPKMIEATAQHGFTNLLTGYGGFQVTENSDYLAAQLGVALNTDLGAVGLDVTQSDTKFTNQASRKGHSWRLSYSKLISPTNTNLSVAAYRYSSRGYLGLEDAMALRDLDQRNQDYTYGTPRGRLQAVVNQSLPAGYGSFFLSGSSQNYWNRGGTDTQAQLGYSNAYKRLNYSLTFARQRYAGTTYGQTDTVSTGNKWDNSMVLTFSVPLGTASHAPYSTTSVQSDSSGRTQLQQSVSGSAGVDNAFSYGVNASRSSSNDTDTINTRGGNVAYQSPFTALTGSMSKSDHYTQTSAGMSGGIVAYAGGVSFTPSMGDTMAVVEAKDAAGARVANGSGLRVDPWGHAVVSSLTPFARNQIEIDPKGLPINVELKSTQQSIAPSAGAVVRLKFETDNPGRAAILSIKMANGEAVPFGAEVSKEQGQSIGTVAQAGRVIARGLKKDTGHLFVAWGDGASERCAVEYTLPPTDKSAAASYSVVDALCK